MMLASDGLPYVIDHFDLAGKIDPATLENADSFMTGSWGQLLKMPVNERDRFPLNFDIVNFPKH